MQQLEPVEVTEAYIQNIRGLGVVHGMIIVPSIGLSDSVIRQYWDALSREDRVQFRFPDVQLRTFEELISLVTSQQHMYYVVDVDTAYVVGEFTLTNFMGKAAQIHFSLHPQNSHKFNVLLCDQIANQILYQWEDLTDLSESFLETLYGLTPVPNRAACIFVQRTGMKKMGILPKSLNYMGRIVDALVTTRTRN